MDNLRGLLDVRRMDRVPNARIRQLCGVTKCADEKIDDGLLRWFGHGEEQGTTGLLSVLVFTQWVGRGRGGLIP